MSDRAFRIETSEKTQTVSLIGDDFRVDFNASEAGAVGFKLIRMSATLDAINAMKAQLPALQAPQTAKES